MQYPYRPRSYFEAIHSTFSHDDDDDDDDDDEMYNFR
jgi:hypothetical protein